MLDIKKVLTKLLKPKVYTLTPASASVTVGTGYTWAYTVGGIAFVNLNFSDSSPSGSGLLFNGAPKPLERVTASAVASATPVRLAINTNGVVFWDTNTSTGWVNASISYPYKE